MSRISLFDSPFLLGFDQFERAFERVTKAAQDGYPPYNVERTGENRLRITVAVAGFSKDDLSIGIEDRQLVVRGKQEDSDERIYLHRGIAARQFRRSFVLADGIEVRGASLHDGLLHIDLERPAAEPKNITIDIKRGETGETADAIDVVSEKTRRSTSNPAA